jgi:hypothetical protein
MKTFSLTALFFATLALAGDDNSTSLFNGKDLTGWVVMNDANFTATNAVLHLERSTGWLRTEQPYDDFILEVEWRALETNYNSGFFLRAGLDGQPFPDNAWQVNLKENALGSLMKGRETVMPSKTPKFPVGEWVKFRIEAKGKTLTLDINGVSAWDFAGLDVDRGYLGLQAEGKSFDFRNLRIQPPPGTLAYLDWRYGFRDLKFEQPVETCNGLVLVEDDGDLKFYHRKDERLELGDAKLKLIEYGFYKGKFATVVITAASETDAAGLLQALESDYGAPTKSPRNNHKLYWFGRKVLIDYMPSPTGPPSVGLWSKPLQALQLSDKQAGH